MCQLLVAHEKMSSCAGNASAVGQIGAINLHESLWVMDAIVFDIID